MLKISDLVKKVIEKELNNFVSDVTISYKDENINQMYILNKLKMSQSVRDALKMFNVEFFIIGKTVNDYVYLFLDRNYNEIFRYDDPID